MEIPIVQSWAHMPRPSIIIRPRIAPHTVSPQIKEKGRHTANMAGPTMLEKKFASINANYTVYNSTASVLWNSTDVNLLNPTNSTDFDYDYQMLNSTLSSTKESWALCKEWTAAQHNLFQTANFFFAAAFLVPSSFKQSVLLVR